MRQAAPQMLVFVEGSVFDGARGSTMLTRPPGDGVVYAPHYYPLVTDPSQVTADLGRWAAVGTSWNVPVFVGEFGRPEAATGVVDFITSCFDSLDALGLSGTEWEYSVAAEAWNSETYSVVSADGTEYPVAQALVRPFARAVAGSAVAQHWDPSSRTFTLTYSPVPQVTEVQLPARAYPSGYQISISGGCYDATSAPGRLLVQPDPGLAQVSVTIASR
jgi:endoglycosylceramidase